jgi:hypothetical protein
MIKPDRGLSLGVEALIAFFVGLEPWLPQDYDFYKKVPSNRNIQRLNWSEL